jgi:hypothetical protein
MSDTMDPVATDESTTGATEAPAAAVAPVPVTPPARRNAWIAPVLITLAVVFALAVGSRVAFGAARLFFGGGFGPGAMMGRTFDGYGGQDTGRGGQGYGRGGMMGRGWQERGDVDADGLCPNCGRAQGRGAQSGQPGLRGRMGPGWRGQPGAPAPSQDATGAPQGSNGNW